MKLSTFIASAVLLVAGVNAAANTERKPATKAPTQKKTTPAPAQSNAQATPASPAAFLYKILGSNGKDVAVDTLTGESILDVFVALTDVVSAKSNEKSRALKLASKDGNLGVYVVSTSYEDQKRFQIALNKDPIIAPILKGVPSTSEVSGGGSFVLLLGAWFFYTVYQWMRQAKPEEPEETEEDEADEKPVKPCKRQENLQQPVPRSSEQQKPKQPKKPRKNHEDV